MPYYRIVCTGCGKTYSSGSAAFRCSRCKAVLEVSYDYKRMDKRALLGAPKMASYTGFLPVYGALRHPVPGGTPLLKPKRLAKQLGLGARLYVKVETGNPTNSFKDRGTVIEIMEALRLGFKAVCCASTGNMALSISTYARLAGLKATVFMSSDANPDKVEKIRKQRARIISVHGDYNKAADLAEAYARKHGAFLCGDYHYRKEGQKTMVFEIMKQLGWKIPDYIFVQVGNATLLAAMYKGLAELKRFGVIKTYPKLVAVQVEGCTPLVDAFAGNHKVRYTRPKTKVDAIAVGFPVFGFEGIAALRKTKGGAISVTEGQINEARAALFKIAGIKSETGGASGLAGLMKFSSTNKISGKTAVVIVTGNNERWTHASM